MSYPGEGLTMSMYGLKVPSPYEVDGHWKECCKHERRIHKGHLAIKGDGTHVFPGIQAQLEEVGNNPQVYYDKIKEHEHACSFDRLFHLDKSYNSKLHRDNRQYTVGLDVLSEEQKRRVPVLSNSEYGRRVGMPLEQPTRTYAQIELVMKGFYRSRGTGIPSSMD